MTDEWTCAGCGISGPDTDRRCDCATAVVVRGKEGEWKTGPTWEEMRARAATPMRCAECNWIATPAPAVKVKALVWEEPCAANNHIYMARAPWGTYGIHIDGGRHRAWLEAHEKPYERWLGDCDVGSLYEAQDAAEEDNEKRTRELIYTTPLDDPRVKALVEAATELEKQAKKAVNLGAVTGPHWTHLGLARMKMATALEAIASPSISALEENK